MLLPLLLTVSLSAPPADALPVRSGMSQAEVRAALGGPPVRIARQLLFRNYQEIWFYDQPTPLWIVFRAGRGQDPHVVTVHTEKPSGR